MRKGQLLFKGFLKPSKPLLMHLVISYGRLLMPIFEINLILTASWGRRGQGQSDSPSDKG